MAQEFINSNEIPIMLVEEEIGTEEIGGTDDSDSEEEVITEDIHMSETEQDSTSDSDYSVQCHPEYFLGRNKVTKWKRTQYKSKCTKVSAENTPDEDIPSPTEYGKCIGDEGNAFRKIINDNMIEEIVKYTNIHIEIKRRSSDFSRLRDIQNTSKSEILAVIGLLYLAGTKRANHTNCLELWADDGTGIQIFRACMSYKRFLFLLSCIRFDDKATRHKRRKTDKLTAIRSVLNQFVSNCKKSYNPSEFLTIDEKLEPFRGRCSFIQYMPNKTSKYGLKIFALADAKTCFTCNLEVYCGNKSDELFLIENTPSAIVNRLIDHMKGTNRNLTCDNWYTSYSLAKSLLQDKITYLGTMRKTTRELPPEFLADKKKQVGSSLFGFQKDMMIVSYVPKKNKSLMLISTMHHQPEIDKNTQKPKMLMDYNMTKGGVEVIHQMCVNYSVSRRARSWPVALFFALLNIAGINANILFNLSHSNTIQKYRRGFLKNLALCLMKSHLQQRAEIKTLPNDIKAFLSKYSSPKELHKVEAAEQEPPRKKGRCCLCGRSKNNSTTVKCTKCQMFTCRKHIVTMEYTCEQCVMTSDSNTP